jgi:hypothetical protein
MSESGPDCTYFVPVTWRGITHMMYVMGPRDVHNLRSVETQGLFTACDDMVDHPVHEKFAVGGTVDCLRCLATPEPIIASRRGWVLAPAEWFR